jgi:hypothetical protein
MIRLLLLSICVIASRGLSACSCAGPPNADESWARSAAVFTGVVESIEDPAGERIAALPEHERMAALRGRPRELGPERGRKVTFRVMQWWKHETMDSTVEVWTGYGGGDCGYPFHAGRSYLVYAYRTHQNLLATGICARTDSLVCSMDAVDELGVAAKTFGRASLEELVAREEPYATYWTRCIKPAVLIGERGLEINRSCYFSVRGVIDRSGKVRDLEVIQRRDTPRCRTTDKYILDRASEWRFRPATLLGEPVEVLLERISLREPITEEEYKAHLAEQEEYRRRTEQETAKQD